MVIVPISWSFKRKVMKPILKAKSESMIKESEFLIIQSAIRIIDIAKEFKGIPYKFHSCPPSNCLVTVSFSLIFPSNVELTDFWQLFS